MFQRSEFPNTSRPNTMGLIFHLLLLTIKISMANEDLFSLLRNRLWRDHRWASTNSKSSRCKKFQQEKAWRIFCRRFSLWRLSIPPERMKLRNCSLTKSSLHLLKINLVVSKRILSFGRDKLSRPSLESISDYPLTIRIYMINPLVISLQISLRELQDYNHLWIKVF